MINNRLRCEDLSLTTQETSSGFEVKSEARFKKVKVVNSAEEDVKVGDEVLISVNAGEEDPYEEGIIIIHITDIIYIF